MRNDIRSARPESYPRDITLHKPPLTYLERSAGRTEAVSKLLFSVVVGVLIGSFVEEAVSLPWIFD